MGRIDLFGGYEFDGAIMAAKRMRGDSYDLARYKEECLHACVLYAFKTRRCLDMLCK